MASSTVTLKLLVDRKGRRVLFAEAGKDFVDFLFSFFLLPVGTFVRLLENQDTIGSFAELYESISDLNDNCIHSKKNLDVLLNVKASIPFFSSTMPLLPTEAFAPSQCSSCCEPRLPEPDEALAPHLCSSCSEYPPVNMTSEAEEWGGGFVKGLTYMVRDDLVVSPMSTVSIINLLNDFDIKDLGALEEKVVHVSKDEGLEILKHSLTSKTVLNDVFLDKVIVKKI